MHTTLRTAIIAIIATLLLATGTPTAAATPSMSEVCTGQIWPPASSLMAEVCETITTHPEGPCGDRPWTGWDCRTLGDRQCGGALGGRGVLR